jgi:NodT family efflux transporter outer membrane factor (OMF) lipoprotein
MKRYLLPSFLCIVGILLSQGCSSFITEHNQIASSALEHSAIPSQWRSRHAQGDFDEKALGFRLSPKLQSLLDEAISYNADLKVSLARLDQSRALLNGISGSLQPQIGIGAQTGTSTLPTSTATISGVGLIASWDIDLWGKVRAEEKSFQAKVASSELDVLYLKQSIAAQTIKSWLMISELTQQLEFSQSMLSLVKQQQELLKVGLSVGRNTQQDLLLNEAIVSKYEAQVIANEQSLSNSRRALEVLLGRYPSAEIQADTNLPQIQESIPAGIPSEVLTRRPDVLAAEQMFKSAFYDVEAAKNARLPAIKIVGGIGYIENSAIQLSNAISNPISSLTAQLLMPLFLGGQLEAQVQAKTASQRQSLATYQKVALNALSDVEGTLSNHRFLDTRLSFLESRVDALRKSSELSKVQLEIGKVDKFQQLQQELNVTGAKSELLHLQSELLVNRVALHQALGGLFQ